MDDLALSAAFDDVLVSIANANRRRELVRVELAASNTVRYQLLEVGAETLHLCQQKLEEAAVAVVGVQRQVLVVLRLATAASASSASASSAGEHTDTAASINNNNNSKSDLSDLLVELSKLREEMAALAITTNNTSSSSRTVAPSSPPLSQHQQQPPTTATTTHRGPLPFDAAMLEKQRQNARPTSSARHLPHPSATSSSSSTTSIQSMLQRAIQDKFKNAVPSSSARHRLPHHASSSSSSSSEDDSDQDEDSPSFILEKQAMEEECDRATKRPPVPPRPQLRLNNASARLKRSPNKSAFV